MGDFLKPLAWYGKESDISGKDGLDTGVWDWLGEDGDNDSKEADSSNFLFSVGLGASLINVD